VARRQLDGTTEDELVDAALGARKRAYAPYSRFLVGAALLTVDGVVVVGCNVENASYGLCICAERTAIATAVALGHVGVRAIAVATGSSPPSPPCGMCRQVLAEFASDVAIILINPEGQRVRTTLKRIFPATFTKALLDKGRSPNKNARR
jgi:cytidine deaminase